MSSHFEPKNKFVSVKLRALEAELLYCRIGQINLDLNSGQIALVSSSLSTRSQFDKAMCVCVQFFSMQKFMLSLSKLLQRAETPMQIKCILWTGTNQAFW